jgi:hypothetical protein
MSFMENSAGHHDCFETFSDYFLHSINNIAPNLFSSPDEMHGFWLDPFYYVLIRIWNNMLTESDEIRTVITQGLIWNPDIKKIEDCSEIQKAMAILYKLYKDLYQIVIHKTFYDRNWKELWDVYFNISDIFKNVCEKNNQTSKSFFNGFCGIYNHAIILPDEEPEYLPENMQQLQQRMLRAEGKSHFAKSQIPDVNEDQEEDGYEEDKRSLEEPCTLTFECNSILELKNNLISNLSFIGSNRRKELGRVDHVEMYPTICRQFDVITEFINGPCRENQELLMNGPEIREGDEEKFSLGAILKFNDRNCQSILNVLKRQVTD